MAAKRKTAKKAGDGLLEKLGFEPGPALKPPPIPKGEAPAVTIGNLRHQLKNLSERLGEKTVECNHLNDQVRRLQLVETTSETVMESLRDRLEESQALIARLEAGHAGYREAIQDIVVGPID